MGSSSQEWLVEKKAEPDRDCASTPELSIVMPVYNEAEAISRVIWLWTNKMKRLGIHYELLIYDDGSTDKSGEILRSLAGHSERIVTRSHENIGHGQTILRGYREALGEWVFEVDSDNEIAPDHFEELWLERSNYDLLLGCRKDRKSPLGRRIITAVSRGTVEILFGKGIRDVNTPYRLIRRSCLVRMLSSIPADSFAPNVIISGLAIRNRLRIHERWVPHEGRRSGTVSIVRWRLWKGAMRSFIQTIGVAVSRDHLWRD